MRLSLLLHAAAATGSSSVDGAVNQTDVRRNKISDILRHLTNDNQLHIDEYKDHDFVVLEVDVEALGGLNERHTGYPSLPDNLGIRGKNHEGTLRI